MIRALPLVALVAPGLVAADDPPRAAVQRIELAQVTIRQRIIIRVPRLGPATARSAASMRDDGVRAIDYKESKGPKCVNGQTLAGAEIKGPNMVDLVVQGGQRLRARLDGDCAPLDFYSGFYIRPAADGRVCAKRDAIRVRSGASCMIAQFRKLTPKR